jgi:lipopolysaccharide transport system ATP-binding protein
VLTPSEGHARCRGRLAAQLQQGSGFNPDFTGIENVFMNAALLGMGQRETEAQLDAILAFADIGGFAHQPTKTYSSGMAVRLAFAVCAHSDPGLLIADEALAVGDELFQTKCYRHLEKLRENGCSILLVSHNPADHVKHCSRSLWLEAGQVMEEGLPKQVVNHYQRHLYTGSLEVPDQPVPESSEESGKASGDGAAPADATASFQAGLSEAFPEWYPARQGVEILSIDCCDAQQRPANCFRPHSGFMLRMRARTSCDLRGLYFACHLRDGSGVEICGLRSAEIEVEANREIRIDSPSQPTCGPASTPSGAAPGARWWRAAICTVDSMWGRSGSWKRPVMPRSGSVISPPEPPRSQWSQARPRGRRHDDGSRARLGAHRGQCPGVAGPGDRVSRHAEERLHKPEVGDRPPARPSAAAAG